MAKFRKKAPWLWKVDKRTGGRPKNGKEGIGGTGLRKIGGKPYRRTSWHQRKVPIANPTSRKRYVRARPNYDAKTKTYTGLTASEMAQRRGGKVVKENVWYRLYQDAGGGMYDKTPVWSVYEEEK